MFRRVAEPSGSDPAWSHQKESTDPIGAVHRKGEARPAPPYEFPTRCARSTSSASRRPRMAVARSPNGSSWSMSFVDWPYPACPGRSPESVSRGHRCFSRSSSSGRSAPPPCNRTTGVPSRPPSRAGPPPNRYELGGAVGGDGHQEIFLSFLMKSSTTYPYESTSRHQTVRSPRTGGTRSHQHRSGGRRLDQTQQKGVTMNNQNSQSLLRRRSWRRRLIRVTCAITLSAAMAKAGSTPSSNTAAPTSNPLARLQGASEDTSADGKSDRTSQ